MNDNEVVFMQLNYPGTCKCCRQPIGRGEYAFYTGKRTIWHYSCLTKLYDIENPLMPVEKHSVKHVKNVGKMNE